MFYCKKNMFVIFCDMSRITQRLLSKILIKIVIKVVNFGPNNQYFN